jgi:hypothetical protein
MNEMWERIQMDALIEQGLTYRQFLILRMEFPKIGRWWS